MGCRHGSYALLPLALLLVLIISFAYLPRMGHAGLPDLTVDSIWLEDASHPGQPVSQVSSGQSFLIVATIKNIGQATASGYYLDVYYDSDYGRGGPDNILAGEVQTWYVGPLTAQDGTHTTKWVVDPDNQIAELDETNNEKDYAFTVGSQAATTTATSSLTSSNPASSSTTTLTLISTVQSTQFVTSILTTTVTSYTGTETSMSTIVVPVTVTLAPLASTVQTTQVQTSTGTTTVTGYTTTTVTSYTGTETSMSTIVVPVTVTLAPLASTVQTTQVQTSTGTTTVTGYTTTTVTSYTGTETSMSTIVVPVTVTLAPLASTVQTTQVQTSTGTTTVTGYTTTTVTSYTTTTTSIGTSVVYTTVSKSAAAVALISSPLIYVGFLSLLGVAVAHRGTARKASRIPEIALSFVQMMFSVREGISSFKPLTGKSLDNGAVV